MADYRIKGLNGPFGENEQLAKSGGLTGQDLGFGKAVAVTADGWAETRQ